MLPEGRGVAWPRMASMQKAICSFGEGCRFLRRLLMNVLHGWTPRANALSFMRLFTELASRSKTLSMADIRASGNEAGEFIAGEQRLLQRRIAGDAGVIGRGKGWRGDFFGVAALTRIFAPSAGFRGRGVVVIGPAFVIEIVRRRARPQVSSSAPFLRRRRELHASTASICLRSDSDWVNSQSRDHASSRVA